MYYFSETFSVQTDSLLVKVQASLYAVGGLAAGLLSDSPAMTSVLLYAMGADIFTGLLASAMGRRGLSSTVGLRGMARKASILAVCLVVYMVERDLGFQSSNVASTVMGWFVVNEFISLLENLVAMNVPFPRALLRLLVVGRDRLERVLGESVPEALKLDADPVPREPVRKKEDPPDLPPLW